MAFPVAIIGMGMGVADLPEKYLAMIRRTDILIGGARHLNYFADLACAKKIIDKDLKALVQWMSEQMGGRRIVVLASGDPLFYGIGGYLSEALGPENVDIFPNFSVVAAAFARLKMPWQQVPVISLHGREALKDLIRGLQKNRTVAVYTDPANNPRWLAGQLLDAGFSDINMWVFESLGGEEEKMQQVALQQAVDRTFGDPNLVVLQQAVLPDPDRRPLGMGLPDHCFAHQSGLITKSEIRAVTLSNLRLAPHHILWDLGAGSGAVGLEATVLVTEGMVYAVEKNPDRVELIRRNKKTFAVYNLDIVEGLLPQALAGLPDPDRIFIGGGGKDLGSIMDTAIKRLKPHGLCVVNTVVLEQLHTALANFAKNGLQASTVQVQVSRSQPLSTGVYMRPLNPVWIITGETSAEES